MESEGDITYLDIFRAAQEALARQASEPDYDAQIAKVKERFPNAYERWTDQEETALKQMANVGTPIEQMTATLGRQPSAVRSRMLRIGLDPDLT